MTVDLDGLLAAGVRPDPGPVLRDREATVVLDAGEAGAWTVTLHRGRAAVQRGRTSSPAHPTTTVRGDVTVLADVAAGRTSGVGAFLDGRVTVRGDLALALQLDGVFGGGAAPDRPAEFPRAHVGDVAGVRTAWLEAGADTAPPVVLLHGLGATNASVLPLLADLARDHRVLAPDLPGFGASGKPRARYDAAFFARWLSVFLTATGAEPAVLVGNSLGGRVAIEAALRAPDQVRALVLLCPSPAFRRLRQLGPVVRLLPPRLAALPLPVVHQVVVEGIRSMFSVPSRLPDTWYAAAADEFVRVFAEPRARVAFFTVLRNIYTEQAFGSRGFWDRLPALDRPALFVWGDRDRLVPAGFARHVAAALPAAGSIVLEDCGHVPQFEHPDELQALVRGFLDGIGSAAALPRHLPEED